MYTFSELIWNIRKMGKIDSRKMQGQSTFSGASKVPGSRRAKATTTSREAKAEVAEANIGNITGNCTMAPGTNTTDIAANIR